MTKKSKDYVEKFELFLLDLTFYTLIEYTSCHDVISFKLENLVVLLLNNLDYKISSHIRRVNKMWKIHVYDARFSNSSLCLRLKKEECTEKEMCINEQSLVEIEALVGKTLVQWDYKILMKFLWELADKIKKKFFKFLIVPTLNKSIQNRLY